MLYGVSAFILLMGKQARKDVHKYELNAIMPKWHELFENLMK